MIQIQVKKGRNMRLGTDLDGVILDCDTAYLNVLNVLLGTSYTHNDITEYDISKCFGISHTLVKSVISAVIESKACTVDQQAIGVLTRLSKIVESPIYIITTRNPRFTDVTEDVLREVIGDRFKYELILHKVYSRSKSDIIKDKKLDIFIEDYAANAYNIATETCCASVLLDKPWNSKYDAGSLGVIRAPSWGWIEDAIYFMK
jgi:uncharacterized HAD superfamily protein